MLRLSEETIMNIGDIVYHIVGGGKFKVLGFNDAKDLVQVECIVATVWCEVGYIEWNLIRRYATLTQERP